MQNVQINNVAVLSGKISDELIFSHEVYDEKFYSFTLSVPRLSGVADEIIITVSEHLLHGKDFNVGDEIMVNGQFRSYNNYSSAGNNDTYNVRKGYNQGCTCDDESEPYKRDNAKWFCFKPPLYHTTPFGQEISDLLFAVNRTQQIGLYPVLHGGEMPSCQHLECRRPGGNKGAHTKPGISEKISEDRSRYKGCLKFLCLNRSC